MYTALRYALHILYRLPVCCPRCRAYALSALCTQGRVSCRARCLRDACVAVLALRSCYYSRAMFDVTAGTVRDLALGWSLGALLPPALLQPHARPALNEEPFYLPHCVAAVFVARIDLSTTFQSRAPET